MTDAVVVRTFLNSIEAEMAQSVLQAAGIEALIHPDDCGGTQPALWMSGVGLLVSSADAERALEILDTPAEDTAADAGSDEE
jgi:hypothetical protein